MYIENNSLAKQLQLANDQLDDLTHEYIHDMEDNNRYDNDETEIIL